MTHTGEQQVPVGAGKLVERPALGVGWRAALTLRVGLLGWSFVLLLGSVLGFGLLTLWTTSLTVVAFWVGIPLTLLSTVLVRWFADLHRRWAADRLGEPVARPYSPTQEGSWPVQLWAVLRDPATWRDWAWLAVNSVTGWFTCGLSFLLFLCGVFYLSYPLVFALTLLRCSGHRWATASVCTASGSRSPWSRSARCSFCSGTPPPYGWRTSTPW